MVSPTSTITVGSGTIGSITDLTVSGVYDIDVAGFGGRLNISGTAQPGLAADIIAITGVTAPFTDYLSAGATEIFNPSGTGYLAPNFALGGDPNLFSPPGDGTLQLGDNLATAQVNLAITFGGAGNDLIVDSSLSPAIFALIDGYQTGDTIDLQGVTGASQAIWTQNAGGSAGGTLSLDSASGTDLADITLSTGSFFSSLFSIATDSVGGTDITVACYRAGTRIATPSGEVAVEDLAIGDAVLTADGTAKPVKWLGRRAYAARFAAGKPHILPIRFYPGALGNGRPRRDLWVSPQHAMLIDGALVPASCLVNGVSIVQEEVSDRVDYVHVELDRHDVIFAEGAASETYINDDNRAMFHNVRDYAARYGADRTSANYCAERIENGPVLEAIRRRLARVGGVATEGASFGDLRGWFERVDIDADGLWAVGWAQDATTPDMPVCLEIVAKGRVVARGLANLYRADLEDAGLGSGCHGFRLAVPTGFAGADVTVRRAADRAPLASAAMPRAA